MVAVQAFLLWWTVAVVAVSLENRTADFTIVKGQLSWDSDGFAVVSECASKRALRFGVMASAPYVALRQRYEDLSQSGKVPILVEVKGVLDSSSSGKGLLRHPSVIDLMPGTCDKPAGEPLPGSGT